MISNRLDATGARCGLPGTEAILKCRAMHDVTGIRTSRSDLLERSAYAEFFQVLLDLLRLIGLYDQLESAL